MVQPSSTRDRQMDRWTDHSIAECLPNRRQGPHHYREESDLRPWSSLPLRTRTAGVACLLTGRHRRCTVWCAVWATWHRSVLSSFATRHRTLAPHTHLPPVHARADFRIKTRLIAAPTLRCGFICNHCMQQLHIKPWHYVSLAYVMYR